MPGTVFKRDDVVVFTNHKKTKKAIDVHNICGLYSRRSAAFQKEYLNKCLKTEMLEEVPS